MPQLGLGPNKGAAFGHEFSDAYLAQVRETLGAVELDEPAPPPPPGGLPYGPAPARAAALSGQWGRGPLEPQGAHFDASDRPLLCMDVSADGSTAVVGGADHGLKEFGVYDRRLRRELFTRTDGHTEWVSCCKILPDGRVISGGVDAKLCLWHARVRPARCTELGGHGASIAALALSADGAHVCSASYDKTLRVWSVGAGGASASCAAVLAAHKAPVMHVAWQGDVLASGDRGGQAVLWDVRTARAAAVVSAHRGHLTALAPADAAGVVTGGHDGHVRLFDARTTAVAAEARALHVGAVNELSWHALPSGQVALVSAGADKALHVLEPRASMRPLFSFHEHRDFIYSLHTRGSYAFSGGGDGMLICHDLEAGSVCFGLGANRAAVRCIHATADKLIAAGDDGGALVYDFGGAADPGAERAYGRATPDAARQPLARRPSAGSAAGGAGAAPRGSAAAASRDAAAYADKRRAAVERASRLRDERRSTAGSRGGDSLDNFCASSPWSGPGGGGGGGGSAPPQQQQQSELDLLHARGDAKFGKPKRRPAPPFG